MLSATEVEAVSVLMNIKPPEIDTAHHSKILGETVGDSSFSSASEETCFPPERPKGNERLRCDDKYGRWNEKEHQRFLKVFFLVF